jgi:hypothetical protein
MARMSAEARGAAHYLAGGKPQVSPKHLSPRAKAIWREIVTRRPVDYFRPGATVLLASFCEMAAAQELNLRALAGEPGNLDLQRAARDMAMCLNSCAVKLRLAVSSVVRAEAGILTEREPQAPKGKSSDLLFGGNVVKF